MPVRVGGLLLKPTEVFNTYWYFAAERQKIFNARYRRSNEPPSDDVILQTYRFTNSYRVLDRVSQFLISKVQQNPMARSDPNNAVFRTLLFKIFNKIETWVWLEDQLGLIDIENFNFEKASALLGDYKAEGNTIYSAAYIMPSPRMGLIGKHANHFALLQSVFSSGTAELILKSKDLENLYMSLMSISGFGRFLAFQYAIDLNYTDYFNFEESTFVVAGPGAIDGISKCFENNNDYSPEEIILAMYREQNSAFERLGIEFDGIPNRPLQPIDCQNLFCEISKYARVAHPEFSGVSGRTRIKQKYRSNILPYDTLSFPAFWNIEANAFLSNKTLNKNIKL